MTTYLDRPITYRNGTAEAVIRAAIYTRVSTVDQGSGASLSTQKFDCFRYCQVAGMVVVAEFQDLQSGLKVDRVQYLEMLRQAEQRAFDVIVVWKLDRFGRDRVESGYQLRELQKSAVRVDSATEPNDSPLLRNILMDFAEEESRRISLRVSANKRTRAQDGKRTSKAPFGYCNVPHPEGGKTLKPNEDAPLVAEVFKLYVSGHHSLADLRDYINQESSTPNRPKTRAGIHNLLKNPAYIGNIRHGLWARSNIQVKSKGERLAEIFEVKGLHTPLVDEEIFQRAQLRLQRNQRKATGRPHASFLFTGLIWCQCGYRFSGKTTGGQKAGGKRITYYCVRKNDAGDCDSRSVSEGRVREAVLAPIETLLTQLKQEDIRQAVRYQLIEYQESEHQSARAANQGVAERLARMEKRLTTWLEMVGDGEMPREQYAKLQSEYGPQIEELRVQLANQPKPETVDLDHLFAVADAITLDALDDQAWREIIEAMVDRILIEGSTAETDRRPSAATIKFLWKPEYEPLIVMAEENANRVPAT